MSTEIPPPHITSKETPREIFSADFPSIGELPIQGGWGYTLEDAVIIDKNDPIVSKVLPFDGLGIEYVFVEKRIYEELIIFRDINERYSGIEWNLLEQSLKHHNNRVYDKLIFEVTALPDQDWEELKAEWESPDGFGTPDFDEDSHNLKRDSRTIRFIAEYWFDITSYY